MHDLTGDKRSPFRQICDRKLAVICEGFPPMGCLNSQYLLEPLFNPLRPKLRTPFCILCGMTFQNVTCAMSIPVQ